MNELAGFFLQPSQTPWYNLQIFRSRRGGGKVGIGKFDFHLSTASISQPRANTLSSKHTPLCNSAQTAVNNLCARAILATCGGFRFRRRA
jgi:hypothetical protein